MKKTKLVISSLLGLGISAFVIPTITSCSSHAMNIDVNISQAQIAEVNSAAEGTVASFEELNIGQLNIVDGYQHFQTSSPFFNLKDIYDEKIDVISV
ncbi:MAG: hypothetical protein K2M43_02830 [Mycoplasmoidaceae bacterium]|nr:hypothetical protein [Mycoplasmoidaceae bacterium]